MNARTRTGFGLAVLILVVCAAIGLLVFGRRSAGGTASDPSYALVTSPLNGDILFAGDPVYVEAGFMLSHRNPAGLELFVDRSKYVLDELAQPYSGQAAAECPSDDPAFCGLLEMRTLWIPAEAGPHTLSACMSGDPSQGAEWIVCSDDIKVMVTDLAAPPEAAGTYFPQAGDTLESVAHKFGLPPLLVAAANPDVEPVAALPGDIPVNVPADPSLIEPADGGATGSPRMAEKVTMTVDLAVDKVYCYYSLGENYWTRMPAGPQTFVYPLSGQLDLTAHFRSLTLPPSGGSLALECWGWSGGSLVYLGRGQTDIGSSTEVQLQGDHFALTGILKPVGTTLLHPLGGTPPPTPRPTPAPKILPPFGLTVTATLAVCINHAPEGFFREIIAPLFCKAAIENRDRILVWEWGAIFPPAGYSDKIDGYKIYKADSFGKLVLIKTIPDSKQKVFVHIGTAKLIELGIPMYCVTAYLGALESAPNCYKLSGEPIGLATVRIAPVPNADNPVSLHTTLDEDLSNKCGSVDLPPYTLDSSGLGKSSGPEGVVAGYSWEFNPDDCVEWIERIFSGSVVFKLDAVKGPVSKAVLSFKQANTVVGGLAAERGVSDSNSCAASLNVVTSVSGPDITSSSPHTSLSWGGYKGYSRNVDVTDAIRSWMLGEPNLGFVLISRPGEVGVDVRRDLCMTAYNDFFLTVTYFVP